MTTRSSWATPTTSLTTALVPSFPPSTIGPSSTTKFTATWQGFDTQARRPRRSASRAGVAPDQKVCIVAVGGTGVGADLLGGGRCGRSARRSGASRVPDDRGGGAPFDPDALPRTDGLEVRAFVPTCTATSRRATSAWCRGVYHLDGADRERPALPLLPARSPLRAELPRAPPARPLPRRTFMEFESATPESIGSADCRGVGEGHSTTGRSRPQHRARRRADIAELLDMAGVDSPAFPATFGFLCELHRRRPSGSRRASAGSSASGVAPPVGDGAATRGVQASDEWWDSSKRSIAGKRQIPCDDLVSDLIAAHDRSGRRDDRELVAAVLRAHRVGADRAPGNCRRFVRA